MKRISTKTHGKLDYLTGLILISSPWIFQYASSNQYFIWIPFALGSLIIAYSMLTRYELGFFPAISMKAHLLLDFLGGVFLTASPWILDFNELIFLPHLVIGTGIVIVAFATERKADLKPLPVKTPEDEAAHPGSETNFGELSDIQRQDPE